MMSKSFFLCDEPDSKLKSDRLSPKQIYESRGSLFHPGAKRGKKRQAKRHSHSGFSTGFAYFVSGSLYRERMTSGKTVDYS